MKRTFVPLVPSYHLPLDDIINHFLGILQYLRQLCVTAFVGTDSELELEPSSSPRKSSRGTIFSTDIAVFCTCHLQSRGEEKLINRVEV